MKMLINMAIVSVLFLVSGCVNVDKTFFIEGEINIGDLGDMVCEILEQPK